MSAARRTRFKLDRHTQIGELAANVRSLLPVGRLVGLAVVAAVGLDLFVTNRPGAGAFILISAGAIIPLAFWLRRGIGLPVLPLIAVQNLILYGLPIAANHEILAQYSSDELTKAGIVVMVHGLVLAGAWMMGMQMFSPAPAISYALVDVNREGIKGLRRLGFMLVGFSTVYLMLDSLGLLDGLLRSLPAGSEPILGALNGACSACGFFLVGMVMGSGSISQGMRLFFWGLLILDALIAASELLLSAPSLTLFAVGIGLFWGSGRLPWRYLLVVACILSFFNLGKFVMRDRYWKIDQDNDGPSVHFTLTDLPAEYQEWADASYDVFLGKPQISRTGTLLQGPDEKKQTLIDRLDNLQNLLFVIHAIDQEGVKPLDGATYKIIPALLIPRIFWPNKPRTHEGQVMLNVHFGRQDLASTFTTYVAWGLLPEAYGNFGPYGGAIFLGIFLGLAFAWLENATCRKLVISMEGFIGFAILISLTNSYEMVASVLVTSMFQSIVPIAAACLPFSKRMRTGRPAPEAA